MNNPKNYCIYIKKTTKYYYMFLTVKYIMMILKLTINLWVDQ